MPPASRTRSASAEAPGRWSCVSGTVATPPAEVLLHRSARESPSHATVRRLPVRSAITTVHPSTAVRCLARNSSSNSWHVVFSAEPILAVLCGRLGQMLQESQMQGLGHKLRTERAAVPVIHRQKCAGLLQVVNWHLQRLGSFRQVRDLHVPIFLLRPPSLHEGGLCQHLRQLGRTRMAGTQRLPGSGRPWKTGPGWHLCELARANRRWATKGLEMRRCCRAARKTARSSFLDAGTPSLSWPCRPKKC